MTYLPAKPILATHKDGTAQEFSSMTKTLNHFQMQMTALQSHLQTGRPVYRGKNKGIVFTYIAK